MTKWELKKEFKVSEFYFNFSRNKRLRNLKYSIPLYCIKIPLYCIIPDASIQKASNSVEPLGVAVLA